MKHPSENDLNLFSSAVLGMLGVCLLLIPAHLRLIDASELNWFYFILGLSSFGAALSLQIISVLQAPQSRARFVQSVSILLLFVFAVLFLRAGYALEACVLFLAGIMQAAALLSFGKYYRQTDLLSSMFVLAGFSGGIVLAASNGTYAHADPGAFKPFLVVGFLLTAMLGAVAMVFPHLKYREALARLHVVPWLAWAGIFIHSAPGANVLVAILFVAIILARGAIPWKQLTLPNDDILGHRAIMIASTLELTLLIFLSALWFAMESSAAISVSSLVTAGEAAFLFFAVISAVIYYETLTIIMTVNGLMRESLEDEEDEERQSRILSAWNRRLARYLKPFLLTRRGIRIRLNAQADQIEILSRQLENEKKRNAQLTLLLELSQQYENQLDQPVAAQLAVHTLERALNCSLAGIFLYEADKKEFMLLAAAGPQMDLIPAGYRQDASAGAMGRAIRQRKTQIINDIRQDRDYLSFQNERSLSSLIIPLIFNGHINGVISISSDTPNAFTSIDVGLAEAVAAELSRAWERSGYHQRLTDLIQAGSHLSSMVEPVSTAQEVATIARDILQARFAFIHIQLGQEKNFTQSASAGGAPQLLASLKAPPNFDPLIKMAYQAAQPFRVRDIRKYPATARLDMDNASLRSMLTIPIRWHRMNIGAIFAFGKQNEVFFTENDESLAELLAIQAAGAFESTWLQQELRASLRITSLLYRLGNQIIQAEDLESAALDIVQTAYKLAKSDATGIVLMDHHGRVSAEVRIDSNGVSQGASHPMELIRDAMSSGQLIYFSQGKSTIRTCLPIQTPISKYGALWLDIPEEQGVNPTTNPNDLQALVNQAAIALERSLLLVESQRQAAEIKAAYDTLEATYDQTLASLISALDARDRETEGHSMRVSQLAVQLGKTLGFTHEQLKVLERGSLLHDIGKIGISDNILHKPGPLNEEEWKAMRQHPDIGAKIVEGIPFLEETIPLIRHHQERWDGTGYPDGLAEEGIPRLARLFAVVDAFDALISNRPYRQKISTHEALQYLREQAGVLFDPQIVGAFEKMAAENQAAVLSLE
jgi:putative nucleotidyltransferase with HDIG domain